jgi:hypothetical protein
MLERVVERTRCDPGWEQIVKEAQRLGRACVGEWSERGAQVGVPSVMMPFSCALLPARRRVRQRRQSNGRRVR